MKASFMETTTVSAERTAAEISAKLGQAGAERVTSEYATVNGRRAVTALYFELKAGGMSIPYRLPVRVAEVRKKLGAKRRRMRPADLDAWAERVAWRMMLKKLEADLAFAATEMASLAEMFLGYVQVSAKQTLYERMRPADLDAWAERVAWRMMLKKLEADLAFAATEMASLAEMFLGYVQVSAKQTLYERMLSNGQFGRLALPDPSVQSVKSVDESHV